VAFCLPLLHCPYGPCCGASVLILRTDETKRKRPWRIWHGQRKGGGKEGGRAAGKGTGDAPRGPLRTCGFGKEEGAPENERTVPLRTAKEKVLPERALHARGRCRQREGGKTRHGANAGEGGSAAAWKGRKEQRGVRELRGAWSAGHAEGGRAGGKGNVSGGARAAAARKARQAGARARLHVQGMRTSNAEDGTGKGDAGAPSPCEEADAKQAGG
jgi:hypothetical protein